MRSMNLEPQKFFIGLLDFFSILLPGMLLTYLLGDDLCRVVLREAQCPSPDAAEGLFAFLIASYLVGHIAFLFGAWWLDELYDALRDRTENGQVRRLVRGRKPSSWCVRALVWLFFKRESNRAVDRAGAIRRKALAPLAAESAINTFQWSKALLAIESPESLATVQRFEADSKFFRSFVVVLLVLGVVYALKQQWTLVWIAAALTLLSFWRFADQRLKSTNQAYWSVITFTASRAPLQLTAQPQSGAATHAGGVVFRRRGERVEFLLVEASEVAGVRVLPKGHIEPGESERAAAIREVHEETGVWAQIREDLGVRLLNTQKGPVPVNFFLMESCARGLASERDRDTTWLPFEAARNTTPFDEARELLAIGERCCNSLAKGRSKP